MIRYLSVSLFWPYWSMNFAVLFVFQGNSDLFVETSIVYVILCLLSQMTSKLSLLFFIQIPSHQGMHSPLTHVTFLPNHLEYPISCTTNSHHVPSRGSSIMICGGRYVIMSSLCSISVDCPGSRSFLFYTRPSSNRVSPSSMFSSSISSFIFCYSYKFSRTTHYHTRNDIHSAHHIVTSRFRLAWICLPYSFFLSSKNDSSRLNVIYFLCSLPSTAWSITSNSMDMCLIDAVTSDDTFTNQ